MEAAVGIREAKNRFSYLTSRVNETGEALTVMKNGRPWVVISPADGKAQERRARSEKLRRLTALIESDVASEPVWDESISDKELLGMILLERYGEGV